MSEEKKSYGKITVGFGTAKAAELEVTDYVQARFKDNRTISVSGIEDGSYCLIVEGLPSTMRLSQESFIGLIATAFIYFECKGIDINPLYKEAAGDEIQYSFSDNLKPIPGTEKEKPVLEPEKTPAAKQALELLIKHAGKTDFDFGEKVLACDAALKEINEKITRYSNTEGADEEYQHWVAVKHEILHI